MNHITQRNQLDKQLQSYKDFVPFCPFDSLPDLVSEMMKIYGRIEKIKEYSRDKLLTEVVFQYDTKQSKANLL